MTTYYLDYVNGSDANNGLGPDASHASNKPWKTIAKALGASGMSSGDTAYLSPAGPFREVVTVNMTSAVAETKLIGDGANAQGFKTSGGVAVTPGEVRWTAYTTNDTTAPSASATLDLNGRDFLTFQSIVLMAGTTTLLLGGTDSTNITFSDCTFFGRAGSASALMTATASFGIALNWLFDRCRFLQPSSAQIGTFTATTAAAGSAYDMNVQFRDCLMISISSIVVVQASGALSSKGNGVHLKNCTVISGGATMNSNDANLSNTVANTIYNNVLIGGGLVANASGGLITENYNRIIANTLRSNVSTGANSVDNATHALSLSIGQETAWGGTVRPFGMPIKASPLLGFGGNSPPSVDILNNPRPSGGASANAAVGAYERSNTFARETSTVRTGSNAISITGPGFQDFELPVSATSTTCTVYVRWDATYAGTKPKMQVLNGSECGVSDATATATGSSGAWEQLSLNFTPTSAGIVTIRFLSSDTNGGGKMFVDDFEVT